LNGALSDHCQIACATSGFRQTHPGWWIAGAFDLPADKRETNEKIIREACAPPTGVSHERRAMNSETIANTRLGKLFVGIMARVMESRFRYRFFGPSRILEGAGIGRDQQVLEIGCGTGFFTLAAAEMIGDQGLLVSMDMLQPSVDAVSEKVRKAGLQNVRVIKGDALDTRLESGSFDQVIIFGVIPAPMLPMDRLMAEMHRVLKPEGKMAVWPAGWVHQSILDTGLFQSSPRQNGVMNYVRK
jgi:SAM-dependent methyltransferase